VSVVFELFAESVDLLLVSIARDLLRLSAGGADV
jgi:hypothetical protein